MGHEVQQIKDGAELGHEVAPREQRNVGVRLASRPANPHKGIRCGRAANSRPGSEKEVLAAAEVLTPKPVSRRSRAS